jgi:hypothetical protein
MTDRVVESGVLAKIKPIEKIADFLWSAVGIRNSARNIQTVRLFLNLFQRVHLVRNDTVFFENDCKKFVYLLMEGECISCGVTLIPGSWICFSLSGDRPVKVVSEYATLMRICRRDLRERVPGCLREGLFRRLRSIVSTSDRRYDTRIQVNCSLRTYRREHSPLTGRMVRLKDLGVIVDPEKVRSELATARNGFRCE